MNTIHAFYLAPQFSTTSTPLTLNEKVRLEFKGSEGKRLNNIQGLGNYYHVTLSFYRDKVKFLEINFSRVNHISTALVPIDTSTEYIINNPDTVEVEMTGMNLPGTGKDARLVIEDINCFNAFDKKITFDDPLFR